MRISNLKVLADRPALPEYKIQFDGLSIEIW